MFLSQSIFRHARQRLQAGEELQSAQSALPEPEVESEKEASDGEDEDDDNVDTVRTAYEKESCYAILKKCFYDAQNCLQINENLKIIVNKGRKTSEK